MSSLNGHLVFAVVSSGCWSGFLHGYNTGVMNAPQDIMSHWLQDEALSNTNQTVAPKDDPKVITVWSVIVAIYCIGGMIGGIVTGVIADRFGRKGGLLLNNAIAVAAVVFLGTAKLASSALLLILGRLLIGINNGLNAGVAPMYLAEISPVNLRGLIGTVYQLMITITILLSQVLGLDSILGTANGWPFLLSITLLPALLQVIMLPFCPESPRYSLLNKGRKKDAKTGLTWLRGNEPVEHELDEMNQEAEKNKITKEVTFHELIRNRTLRQPLIIAVVVMIAQQLSGINAIMFYSTTIFKNAGLDEKSAQYATLVVGAMNVVMTLVSLLLVEKAGRKTLLLTGFIGMLICTVLLFILMFFTGLGAVVHWACVLLVVLFVVSFAVGPGSIPWFLVNELFNQSARPAAAAVAVSINWTANFIVGLSFLPLATYLGHFVYLIFVVMQFIFIVFIFYKVPETKNKTTEEITAMFRQQM